MGPCGLRCGKFICSALGPRLFVGIMEFVREIEVLLSSIMNCSQY